MSTLITSSVALNSSSTTKSCYLFILALAVVRYSHVLCKDILSVDDTHIAQWSPRTVRALTISHYPISIVQSHYRHCNVLAQCSAPVCSDAAVNGTTMLSIMSFMEKYNLYNCTQYVILDGDKWLYHWFTHPLHRNLQVFLCLPLTEHSHCKENALFFQKHPHLSRVSHVF